MSESDDELRVDIEDPDVLKDFRSIFIGAMTKQCARENDFLGASEHKKFLKEVRAFLIKCANYLQTSMSVLKSDIIKSLTFLRLSERHQATLDELHVLIQRFPRVITDINALESEFCDIKQLQMMDFQLILTRMISPCALITFDTKYVNKLIYTLINRVLNSWQNLLDFYFGVVTVIIIVIEIPTLMVVIT